MGFPGSVSQKLQIVINPVFVASFYFSFWMFANMDTALLTDPPCFRFYNDTYYIYNNIILIRVIMTESGEFALGTTLHHFSKTRKSLVRYLMVR